MNRSQCTICQDFLLPVDIVGCPCGHTFHHACISQWNKVNNSCPQCRQMFHNKKPVKLFFNLIEADEDEPDPAELKNKLQDLETKMTQKDLDLKQKKDKIAGAKKEMKITRAELEAVRQALEQSENVNNALKRQLVYLEKHKEEAIKAKMTSERLQKNLDNLENVKGLIRSEKHEIENMLKRINDSPDSLNQIVSSFVIIKKEFETLKASKNKLNDEKKAQRREVDELRRKLQASVIDNKSVKDQLKLTETDLLHIERERQNLQRKLHAMEQAVLSPSPRASAIKRLLQESPAPMAFKKARTSSSTADEDENSFSIEEVNDEQPPSRDFENDDVKDLAVEIGLKFVDTTSVIDNSSKAPLGESKRIHVNMKLCSNNSNKSSSSSSSAIFPVVQKGYNGLGGQSKFIKPSNSGFGTKKLSCRVKIPKSSTTKSQQVDRFLIKKNPTLPNFELSPE